MVPPQLPAAVDRLEPTSAVCLAALTMGHGLVRITERYLPAFVVSIGYGPVVVGSLATLGLGVAAVAASRSSDGVSTPVVALCSTLLAAAGLLALAGAPTLDALLGTPLSALGWLAIGVALLAPWYVRGPTRGLWPLDTRAPPPTIEAADPRTRAVIGALGVATAAPIAVAAVASADTVGTGIALLSAIGAAAALVAAVALGSSVEAVHGDGRSLSVASETPTLERARTVVADLPDRARWAIVGDALVRVAIVGVSPFLVLLVVDYEPVGFSIGGFTLAPIAVFGAFVLVEAAGAILGAIGSPRVRSSVDRRVLLAVGLVGVSLFPMALVAAPTSAGVVAVLFGLFGCRTAIEPLRPTVGASARDAPIPGSSATEDVRAVVRLAVVLAPLVAGVLYAVDPLAAFTAATTVGLLGVRELGRAFQFGRDG